MNDDAGWNGSGGLVDRARTSPCRRWSGPRHGSGGQATSRACCPAPSQGGYYRDVTVLAVPTLGDYRIPGH